MMTDISNDFINVVNLIHRSRENALRKVNEEFFRYLCFRIFKFT